MIRKIIKQGHNTLTITLPSEWVKRFNLQSGSEIDVSEKENGLFLSTTKNGDIKKAEINISGMDNPTIWKYFMAVYREGYDEVLVKFDSNLRLDSPYKYFVRYKRDLKYDKQREKDTALEFMHKLVNRFIGFEVTDTGKDFVVIKDMSEPTAKEFDNSLRRVFFLVQQMAEETCQALGTGEFESLKHIHDVDINLDKFHDYCIRIMNKVGNKDIKKTSLLFSILYLLELTGDEYKNISHHLIRDFTEKNNLKNIKEIADLRKEQIDLLYETFYKFDQAKIQRISDIDKHEFMIVKDQYRKCKVEEEKEVFHHLRVMARYINALIELRIEMEF